MPGICSRGATLPVTRFLSGWVTLPWSSEGLKKDDFGNFEKVRGLGLGLGLG